MAKLVIVESPSKIKTIKKVLGSGYEVVATIGHIRDLPKTVLGVDVDKDFRPHYVDIAGKSALIRQLKSQAEQSDGIYLATDPDREGEAISWHLAQILGLDMAAAQRVTFNEITKTGITQGMAHPRALNMDLVNAQQARRILDRIVGYKLSPFLWEKVRKGLSAGRVQSAAVAMVVAREDEIRAFKSEEYWNIDAKLSVGSRSRRFNARLYGTNTGKKLTVPDKAACDKILADLENAVFTVSNVKRSTRQVTPAPPFTTSTMQQEASRKLNFAARRTMSTAQELYEGVDIAGIGAVGLITYMRTDSLRISDEARTAANNFILETYGQAYLPPKSRVFKTKSNAQDAHEAIRPTDVTLTPDAVKDSLTNDQYKLYKLIWERFVASLMANCMQDTCQADITADKYLFKASGYSVRFDGYTKLYVEGRDDEDEESSALPAFEEGDTLCRRELTGTQHFTQPPARYTEATLIKAFEETGIGRPSTYATTITTILSREYIERDGKSLKPTTLGEVTTRLMREHFSEIVDVDFTAHMEEQLDAVESGKNEWVATLRDFYTGFAGTLKKAEAEMSGERVALPAEESDIICEKCGRRMVIKTGRYGKFLACPGYPACKNTKHIVNETPGVCPLCGGRILQRRSRKGRAFYGCENYPTCNFVSWEEPSDKNCPRCGKTLFKRKGKNGGLHCLTEGCEYEEN